MAQDRPTFLSQRSMLILGSTLNIGWACRNVNRIGTEIGLLFYFFGDDRSIFLNGSTKYCLYMILHANVESIGGEYGQRRRPYQ